MITTDFVTFWTLVDDNLTLLGRKGSRLGPAWRLYWAGLNASEVACLMAPYQERTDNVDTAIPAFVGAAELQEGARS